MRQICRKLTCSVSNLRGLGKTPSLQTFQLQHGSFPECHPLSPPVLPRPIRSLPNSPESKTMNAPFSPTALINPFALPSRVTLADVAEQVATSSLSPTRKRDCLSALRRVGDLLGQD